MPLIQKTICCIALTHFYWSKIGDFFISRNIPDSDSLPPAKRVEEFACTELKKMGITQPIIIRMQPGISGATNGSIVYIGSRDDGSSELNKLLWAREQLLAQKECPVQQEQLKKVEDSLLKYKAIIQHEGGHIKAFDIEKNVAAVAALPLIVYGAIKSADKAFLFKEANGLGKAIKKGIVGLSAFGITSEGIKLWVKQREYYADDAIENDPRVLRAYIEHLAQHDAVMKAYFLAKHPKICYEELSRFPFNMMYAYLHKHHPIPENRIERVRQRFEK